MNHELKVWPDFYKAIVNKTKQFEIRKNDRNFKVGDNLILQEFEPCIKCNGTGTITIADLEKKLDCDCNEPHGMFTGNRCDVIVSYILHGGNLGLDKDYVVMSISIIGVRKVYK